MIHMRKKLMPKRLTTIELARLYSRIASTHPSYPTYHATMQEVLKQIVGHHLADALEADEFEKHMEFAEFETGDTHD